MLDTIYENAKDQHVSCTLVYGLMNDDSETSGKLFADAEHQIPLGISDAADIYEHTRMMITYQTKSTRAGYMNGLAVTKIGDSEYLSMSGGRIVTWEAGESE